MIWYFRFELWSASFVENNGKSLFPIIFLLSVFRLKWRYFFMGLLLELYEIEVVQKI